MVFSSVVFLFYFLPVFAAAYILCRPLRSTIIVIGSLAFYGWGDPRNIGLLLAFIVFNWLAGLAIGRREGGRAALAAACCGINLVVLVFYKYLGFVADQVNVSLAALGFLPWTNVSVDLPLGVSFFTFQGMSYLIDVARRDVSPQPSLLKFAMYKAMFPQLIAGPIVRYRQIAHEIDRRDVTFDRLALGTRIFVTGLAQKVLIANTVAVAADGVFNLPSSQVGFTAAWFGVACYTVQIYFDFGGYSNMAIGLGHMLGFTLPRNFNNPYIAASMTDFWRRWHITLSTWFRDYLYLPLGGNRRGNLRTYLNLVSVFVLCGLWHGASWTFAIWGLFHGAFLVLERLCRHLALPRAAWPIRHAYVLLVVMVGWVLFRSVTLTDAGTLLRTLGGFGHPGIAAWPVGRFATESVLTALAAAVVIVVGSGATADPAHWLRRPIGLVPPWAGQFGSIVSTLVLFCLSAIAVSAGTYNPFIYFHF